MAKDLFSQGTLWLTEGGTETEIMYRHGHTFPHFAMFELLRSPAAMADLRAMYRSYLDTVAATGFGAMIGGLDYRASPDWAHLLGYSDEGLAEIQKRCVAFLREVSEPYRGRIPQIAITGVVGPRGDAYALNRTMTAEQSQDYHGAQLATLKSLDVDLAWAATFNNVPEAVGVARAAAELDLPVVIAFTLTGEHRLRAGPTLRDAVEAVDREAGAARPLGYGINCSHPLEFEPALEPGAWQARLRSLRPNAASMDKIALCKLDHLEEGDPADLAARMGDLARRLPSVDMWGGCCGTWHCHLGRIAEAVATSRARAA